MRQIFTVLRWGAVGVGILLGVGNNILSAYQIVSLGLPSQLWTAIAFALFAAGLISLVLHYRRESQLVAVGSALPEVEVVKPDKLTLVVKAIAEAEQNTRKGQDVAVYITDDNGLSRIYPSELKEILLKLQDDKRVLTLKTFPDWLLESDSLTQEKIIQEIEATIHPERNNFTINISKNFAQLSKKLHL
jgi:hypothetical protein